MFLPKEFYFLIRSFLPKEIPFRKRSEGEWAIVEITGPVFLGPNVKLKTRLRLKPRPKPKPA
jgi:hypothetical protein